MTYSESMEYIRQTAAFGTKLGLDNIRTLLSLLGDPQEKLKFIHIAGTNGKGSVAAYILSVLEKAGLRAGFYTSPELNRFSERIRINEEEISEEDVAGYASKIRGMAEYMSDNDMGAPSEFELVLAMAFCYFLDNDVDVVILEVGLGGRLDATNVISASILSVITKISFDHMQYLGNTLSQIASEKAAIIKPGGKVIVYPTGEEVMNVFREKCREQGAEFHVAELPSSRDLLHVGSGFSFSGQEFILSGKKYITEMAGVYETENASLAIQAVRLLAERGVFNISDEDIYEGIRDTFWPGRFEILSVSPLIIVDGAHNEDGAAALAKSLQEHMGERKVIFCMGILKDKQYEKMLVHLLPLAEKVISCTVPNPRSLKAKELADIIRKADGRIEVIVRDTLKEAVETIKKLQRDATAIVICGSLYLAGPMREYFRNSF